MSLPTHYHVYIAGKRDRAAGPPRFYATNGVGFWSRADANTALNIVRLHPRGGFVRQCHLAACKMKDRYPDR